MQSLKSIRLAEVDNFFKQSFEQKKLIPLYVQFFNFLVRLLFEGGSFAVSAKRIKTGLGHFF